jgi:hypothetical protein
MSSGLLTGFRHLHVPKAFNRSRPSKFNALLAAAFDQAEDGNSSDGSLPMIESDTSTDEEGEEDEENQGQREKAANEKGDIVYFSLKIKEKL